MKCCLCDGEVEVQSNGWCHGHNAEPLVKNGRCCETCNSSKVIPARLLQMVILERNKDGLGN